MSTRYRPTWLEIRLDHIHDNFERIQAHIGKKTVIPVVKANAYGHGAVEVTGSLREKGVRFFAVSLLEEALELRRAYDDIDILILGVVRPFDFDVIQRNDLIMTVNDMDVAKDVLAFEKGLRCHVKVDTGMNRLGIKDAEDIVAFFEEAKSRKRLSLEGIYTHFATADGDETFLRGQLAHFRKVLSALPYKPDVVHVSNSAATWKYERDIMETDAVRVGVSLYGFDPNRLVKALKPTFFLKTSIVQRKALKKGEKVGYGITYEAKSDETIGIIPIGYADGLIRKNQDGLVEINGRTYPLVGRVCMDYAFVRIDDDVAKNAIVTVLGGAVSVDDVAQRLETIPYEVFCTITSRVPRVYESGE